MSSLTTTASGVDRSHGTDRMKHRPVLDALCRVLLISLSTINVSLKIHESVKLALQISTLSLSQVARYQGFSTTSESVHLLRPMWLFRSCVQVIFASYLLQYVPSTAKKFVEQISRFMYFFNLISERRQFHLISYCVCTSMHTCTLKSRALNNVILFLCLFNHLSWTLFSVLTWPHLSFLSSNSKITSCYNMANFHINITTRKYLPQKISHIK